MPFGQVRIASIVMRLFSSSVCLRDTHRPIPSIEHSHRLNDGSLSVTSRCACPRRAIASPSHTGRSIDHGVSFPLASCTRGTHVDGLAQRLHRLSHRPARSTTTGCTMPFARSRGASLRRAMPYSPRRLASSAVRMPSSCGSVASIEASDTLIARSLPVIALPNHLVASSGRLNKRMLHLTTRSHRLSVMSPP